MEQRVEMARTVGRDHAVRMEQEHELPEVTLVARQGLGVEPFVRLLVRALVVEPSLADVRDQDPVAAEVDRIVKRLVDRRDLPAGERTIERVLRPLPLDDRDIALAIRSELAEHGIGELAVGLDVLLAGERVTPGIVDRPGVSQQFAEDVVEEVAEDLLLLVGIHGTRGDDRGPFLQFRPALEDRLGQAEAQDGQADHVGAEDGLGFNRHGRNPRRASASIGMTRDASS
jgi:hypothetical protein